MAESMCSSFASVSADRDVVRDIKFKAIPKEEYFIEDEIKIHFQFADESQCPSYLDVVRIVPLSSLSPSSSHPGGATKSEANGMKSSKMATSCKVADNFEAMESTASTGAALVFSYCHWKVESGPGLFSISTKAEMLVKDNKGLPAEGVLYIAQYMSAGHAEAVAESETFRVYPVNEESMIELPGVFSDDGLIVLGSGSDTEEPELVENDDLLIDEPGKAGSSSSEAGADELAIVMSSTELRKMEEEQRTSNDKLRSFIDQYKEDLMELTRCNETLKQKLNVEQLKTEKLVQERRQLSEEMAELKMVMAHQQTLFQKALTERERQLREEQRKVSKLEEEHSLVTGHLDNLEDAHLETKNILVQELERIKKDNEAMAKELKEIKEIEKVDKATEMLPEPEIKVEKNNLVQSGQSNDLEERVHDLIGRLQTAKLEYISLYKENKRKEKALENICNWASLAKDGMSLEAPAQVPSLVSLSRNKFSTCGFDEYSALFPKAGTSSPAVSRSTSCSMLSPNKCSSSFVNLRSKESQGSVEEDLIELSSDSSRLLLPPRQKRKIELVRRTASSAAATAGASSGAALRALRGKMVVRGRHRAQEAIRTLKRDVSALEHEVPSVIQQQQSPMGQQNGQLAPTTASSELPATSANLKPGASLARPKIASKKKDSPIPKPSAPEESSGSATSAPRGTNTYSAAGLISDVETDASNTDDQSSVTNPHICPLCMTSILDYEAHMREAHQKQPCPICGYVFDTNIPLYVMTYHIERHLEDDNADGPTTAASK